MFVLKSGSGSPVRASLVGFALLALGVVILLSGIAVLMLVAAAGTVIGGAVMLFRKATGRPLMRPAARAPSLEVKADYEILPPMHDRPGESQGDRKD